MAEIQKGKLKTARVLVKEGIDAKAVHAALDRILELSGCPTCGFQGILRLGFEVINPEITNQVGRIDGIVGVGVEVR